MTTNLRKDAENIALEVVLWPFLLTFLAAYFIFHDPSLPVGKLLAYTTVVFVVTSFFFYLFGYVKSQNIKPRQILKEKEAFTISLFGIFLAIIYSGAAAVLTVILSSLILRAYPGAHVIRIAVALSGAVAAALASYLGIIASYSADSLSITKNLTLFMFGGLLLSAITQTNPNWYTESFSYLGMTPSISAQIFNFTMIFTGLGAFVLSFYLFKDFKSRIPEKKKYIKTEKFLKPIFWTMGLGITMVGLIPWQPGIQGMIHTLGAVFAGLFFFLMAVFAKKLLPGMQKMYYLISYLMAGIVFSTFLLYALGKNTLATVEIIAFISVFVWIFITLKCLDLLDYKK